MRRLKGGYHFYFPFACCGVDASSLWAFGGRCRTDVGGYILVFCGCCGIFDIIVNFRHVC